MALSTGLRIFDMTSATNIEWSRAEVFLKSVSSGTTFTFSNVTDTKSVRLVVTNVASTDATLIFTAPLGFTIVNGSEVMTRMRASTTQVYEIVLNFNSKKIYFTAPIKLDATPSGIVASFAGSTAPWGWLVCEGAVVSRSTYSDLFSSIGTIYGSGDGVTTFHLPDYRGVFLRGLDNGRNLDSGRSLGSYQDDMFKSHGHRGPNNITGNPDAAADSSPDNVTNRSYWRGGFLGPLYIPSEGGVETRPKNVSARYIIKI